MPARPNYISSYGVGLLSVEVVCESATGPLWNHRYSTQYCYRACQFRQVRNLIREITSRFQDYGICNLRFTWDSLNSNSEAYGGVELSVDNWRFCFKPEELDVENLSRYGWEGYRHLVLGEQRLILPATDRMIHREGGYTVEYKGRLRKASLRSEWGPVYISRNVYVEKGWCHPAVGTWDEKTGLKLREELDIPTFLKGVRGYPGSRYGRPAWVKDDLIPVYQIPLQFLRDQWLVYERPHDY